MSSFRRIASRSPSSSSCRLAARRRDPDIDPANDLRDQIADAMPEADSANHKLQFGLELFDAVHAGIAMFELEGAVFGTTGALGTVGALGLAAAVVAPLAAEAAVFVAIGNAHAEAINSLIDDEIRSGFSRGVVLGADDRKTDYIKENFVKHSPVRNSVYPEYGTKFQNAYNRALVAGYAQGRRLLESKATTLGVLRGPVCADERPPVR